MEFVLRNNKAMGLSDTWKYKNPSVLSKFGCNLRTQANACPRDTPQHLQCCLLQTRRNCKPVVLTVDTNPKRVTNLPSNVAYRWSLYTTELRKCAEHDVPLCNSKSQAHYTDRISLRILPDSYESRLNPPTSPNTTCSRHSTDRFES